MVYYTTAGLVIVCLYACVKARYVKIIAVAVVKPNGKFDVLDVELHPWKPPLGSRWARPGLRPGRGAALTQLLTGAGLLSAGDKQRHDGSGAQRRPSTGQLESKSAPENFALHNSRDDDGNLDVNFDLSHVVCCPRDYGQNNSIGLQDCNLTESIQIYF